MKIGFIGLGKMGFNRIHRLLLNKHEVVVWRPEESFTMKMSAALRNPFGGHVVKSKA